ncbi:MocR-like pyridoxine biosynthesis transcription factor PdxR [Mesorhizobium sp. A623]
MTIERKSTRFQFINLARSDSRPIYRQLEGQIRDAVLTGAIRPGMRLPSSRVLAADLGVSRPTIVQVYEYLALEGFLKAKRGSGTFVSSDLEIYQPPRISSNTYVVTRSELKQKPLSLVGSIFSKSNANFELQSRIAFLPNVPAYDLFPFARWEKIRNNHIKKNMAWSFGYEDAAGHLPLRRSIAEYLAVHRGDHCDAEHILIVPGAHFAFHLATLLLTDPGDKVWLEDPGPENLRIMLSAMGRNVASIDVDQEGMDVSGAIRHHSTARIAFTMPSRQHPLGVTLSLARRLRLLAWAEKNNSWIVEDDYDSEFRYSSRALASMRSIDDSQNVIYVGTFSKSLFPALRIAYMVIPEYLIGTFRTAIGSLSRSMSSLDQATLSIFIDEGYFATYIKKMHELYGERRDIFTQTAKRMLSGLLEVDVPESGINTIGWLPLGTDDKTISIAAQKAGIYSQPLSNFRDRLSDRSGLVLGFGGFREVEIKSKLADLATVLEKLKLS